MMDRGVASLRFSFPRPLLDSFRAFDPPPSRPEATVRYGRGRDARGILTDLSERIPRLLPECLCLHAAAVSRKGRALILPAAGKGGKSTLAAALVHHGWSYYSDDLAIISIRDGRLSSFPRPIDLRSGAIDLLPPPSRDVRVHPPTDPEKADRTALRVSRRKTGRGPVPVRWIVFPRVRLGGPTRLVPLEGGEAVLRLCRMACNLSRLGQEGFEAVVSLVRGGTCFALEVGRLRDGLGGLLSLPDLAADLATRTSIL